MNAAELLALVATPLGLMPALLLLRNLRLYARGDASTPLPASLERVSILIPARDEEAGIESAVRCALASRGVDAEVIVLDDHSADRTPEIVAAIAAQDPRLRLAAAPPLPTGWCGKQHACHALSTLATRDVLVFIDADVRLAPDGVREAVAFLDRSGASLVSGIPRQITGSPIESLLIPLIHFVLLGFLPIGRMRGSTHPAYGAGCGQLFVARRADYRTAGGHAAIRASLHDGITLPRAFRRAGLKTDLFDATSAADCRMYRGGAQTWRGLAKNATEAMAAPRAIVVWTVLLLMGQVLPWILLPLLLTRAVPSSGRTAGVFTLITVIATTLFARYMTALRFRQSLPAAALHPIANTVLVTIQWYALVREAVGLRPAWRGRRYPAPEKTHRRTKWSPFLPRPGTPGRGSG